MSDSVHQLNVFYIVSRLTIDWWLTWLISFQITVLYLSAAAGGTLSDRCYACGGEAVSEMSWCRPPYDETQHWHVPAHQPSQSQPWLSLIILMWRLPQSSGAPRTLRCWPLPDTPSPSLHASQTATRGKRVGPASSNECLSHPRGQWDWTTSSWRTWKHGQGSSQCSWR